MFERRWTKQFRMCLRYNQRDVFVFRAQKLVKKCLAAMQHPVPGRAAIHTAPKSQLQKE